MHVRLEARNARLALERNFRIIVLVTGQSIFHVIIHAIHNFDGNAFDCSRDLFSLFGNPVFRPLKQQFSSLRKPQDLRHKVNERELD